MTKKAVSAMAQLAAQPSSQNPRTVETVTKYGIGKEAIAIMNSLLKLITWYHKVFELTVSDQGLRNAESFMKIPTRKL